MEGKVVEGGGMEDNAWFLLPTSSTQGGMGPEIFIWLRSAMKGSEKEKKRK